MGEVVPPQVYLDLGSSFLDDGDIRNAAKTFDKANDVLDYGGYRRKVASAFEQKRYVKSALRSYEKLLITEFNDVGLLVKIGELKEQLGRDEEANLAYRRALDVLSGGNRCSASRKTSPTLPAGASTMSLATWIVSTSTIYGS